MGREKMWSNNVVYPPCKGFLTPPPASSEYSKPPYSSLTDCKKRSPANRSDRFHVIHKVPSGNSPYVRAKHVQLIEKDPSRAISLFWSAINAGDRVDSALKDMAVVMKQLDRSDEAIEAIKSFRHLCSNDSQESLDNVLVELYKRAGRIDQEIEMLQNKLKCIEEGTAFGGRRTKTARSQGKKVHITVEQEKARILGNLAWAYLQQTNYVTAAEYYTKALVLESDKNKQCNLAICLMHMNRIPEAKSLLQAVRASSGKKLMDEAYAKSFERAQELLTTLETGSVSEPHGCNENCCQEIPRTLSSPMVPRRSEDVQRKETYRFKEQNTESYLGTQFDATFNFQDSFTVQDDNRSSRLMSPRGESTVKHTQQAVSVNKLNDYSKMTGEWRFRMASLKKNCIGTSASKATPFRKKSYFSPAPPTCNVQTPFTQPRRCLWGFGDGNQTKAEGWRKQVVGNSKKYPSGDEDWRRNNSTNDESNLSQNLTAKPPTVCGQPVIQTPQPTPDTSDHNKKKSWADMVEEEEEEEGLYEFPWTGEEAFSEESLKSNTMNESPCLLQTQMKPTSQKQERIWGGWNSEEEFNDENMNSNIVYESPRLQNQMKKVTRKLEFCDLNNSSSNQSVQRNLYFDQYQKRGDSTTASSCSSSPAPGKDLNFDGLNSLQSKLRGSISGNDINLLRRPHRLKVFQEITRYQGSP